jgi:hypothetical protein
MKTIKTLTHIFLVAAALVLIGGRIYRARPHATKQFRPYRISYVTTTRPEVPRSSASTAR